MSTQQDIAWQRGQTEEWALTVTNADGSASNLSTVTAVELEIKPLAGAPDPATIHLGLGAGITVRDQSIAANVGICDIAATAAQTNSLYSGRWAYDVFVTRADGARKKVVYGTLTVGETVNFP